jgi:hypothetical protein
LSISVSGELSLSSNGFGSRVRNLAWIQSVPPAVAGGCAALRRPRLRTHPLPRVVLTSSKFEAKPLHSEVSRLGKRGPSGRVGDGVRVSSEWVNGPSAARLCCKHPVGTDAECLPGCKCERVGYGRRRTAVALENLCSDCVVLSLVTDTSCSLDHNGDGERR